LRLRQIGFRLIGVAILALILSRLDLEATLKALAGVRFGYVFLALAASPLVFGLKTWRWRELLKIQGIAYSLGDAFLAFMAGLFLGLVTPGRLGEMGRALYLKQDLDVPVSEGLANVLMDRLFDLYTILVLGSAGLVWFRLLPPWALAVIVAGTAGALLMPIALLSERLAAYGMHIVAALPFIRRRQAQLAEATTRFQLALRPLLSPHLIVPLLLTLLAYALFFAQMKLLALALDLDVSLPYLAVCLSIAGVITLLPISFSGLGTRDAILIALFSPIGLPPEEAVAFSTLFFLVSYVASGSIGGLAWQLKPLKDQK
jgi:uncharacterized protein (TIRG00374 family)